MRTNIPNKTSTPKYPRFNGKQRFMGKEGLKQSGPIQDRGRHPINKKKVVETDRPKNARIRAFETIEPERFQEGVYFFFQQLRFEKEYQHKMSDEGCHFEE